MRDADEAAGRKVLQAGLFADFAQSAGYNVFIRLLLAFGKVPAAPAEYHETLPVRVLHQAAGGDNLVVRLAEQFELVVVSKCDTFVADVYFMHFKRL
jgi:hypothetical protein